MSIESGQKVPGPGARPGPMRARLPAPFLALLLLAALLAGCSGERPGELLATADLEEKQGQPERARKLYERLVAGWPDAPEAAQARARLAAIGSGGRAPIQP